MSIVASIGNSVGATAEPWSVAIKTAVRSGVELCRRLALPVAYEASAAAVERAFPVFAPLGFVSKMRIGDPHDPLLRQVLPLEEELVSTPGFSSDPVADQQAQLTAGLLQKYSGRVLLVTTGVCAIHCRYCFRRHYPYSDGPPSHERWAGTIRHIAADRSIEEVILSGGDPLTISDERLAQFADELARIPHLRRLRVHSRLPIVIPQRVTDRLLGWLRGTRLSPIMVVHANHPRELDGEVSDSLAKLVDAGVPVLNQSVLLRGVNDDGATLVELCQRLIDLRVIPYYLHQLDRVAGAAHFEVTVRRGLELMDQLRRMLPGYAVPRYVQEFPGDTSKRWIS